MASVISDNETEFIRAAIREGIRIDGRTAFDMRGVKISFGESVGQAQVQMGPTRVLATVTADIVQPYPDRPVEGMLNFFVDFSPMALASWEEGRPTAKCVEIARLVERAIRDSNTLDTEALCILAGQKVWSIRCDVHVLDHDGNLADACNLAAVAALSHFRRPDVTVLGDTVTIHSISTRQPVPLDLHHRPLSLSFAFFNEASHVVLDPSLKEEQVADGVLTLTLNQHLELCCLQKPGGLPISMNMLHRCSQTAAKKAAALQRKLDNVLSADGEKAGRKVYQSYAKGPPPKVDKTEGQGKEQGASSSSCNQASQSSTSS